MSKRSPLLLISLFINIALIAYLASNAIRPQPEPEPNGAPIEQMQPMQRLMSNQAIDSKTRQEIRRKIRLELPALRAYRSETFAARQNYHAAIKARPFDVEAVNKAAATLAAARERQWLAAVDVHARILGSMPPEARSALIDVTAKKRTRVQQRKASEFERD